MSEGKIFACVAAAGLIAELISFGVLTALGANNEILAIASLVCLIVASFFAGDLGSHESRGDGRGDARRGR